MRRLTRPRNRCAGRSPSSGRRFRGCSRRRTKFGHTAELVRTAHVVSSQQKAVLRVVRNLAGFNGIVIAMLVAYTYSLKMPPAEIIPLVLTAVLASIPVALPATFTLGAAIAAPRPPPPKG
jgi:H+-transporting ATPase